MVTNACAAVHSTYAFVFYDYSIHKSPHGTCAFLTSIVMSRDAADCSDAEGLVDLSNSQYKWFPFTQYTTQDDTCAAVAYVMCSDVMAEQGRQSQR